MNRRRSNAARMAWNCLVILLVVLTSEMPEVLATSRFTRHSGIRFLSPLWGQNLYMHPWRYKYEDIGSENLDIQPNAARVDPYFSLENRKDPADSPNLKIRRSGARVDPYFHLENRKNPADSPNLKIRRSGARVDPYFHLENRKNPAGSQNLKIMPRGSRADRHFDRIQTKNRDDDVWRQNSSLIDERFMDQDGYPGENYGLFEKGVYLDDYPGSRHHPYHGKPRNYYPPPHQPAIPPRFANNQEVSRLSPADQQRCVSRIHEFEQLSDICNVASQIVHIVDLLKRRSYLVRWLLQNNVRHANIGRPSVVVLLNRTIRQLTKTNDKMKRMLDKGSPKGYKKPKWIAERPKEDKLYQVSEATTTKRQTVTPSKPITTTSTTTSTQSTLEASTSTSTVPSTEETSLSLSPESSQSPETTATILESTTDSSSTTE